MGLLDWLQDSLGSSMSPAFTGQQAGMPPGAPPAPPMAPQLPPYTADAGAGINPLANDPGPRPPASPPPSSAPPPTPVNMAGQPDPTSGFGGASAAVPMPTPRPAGAPGPMASAPPPMPGAPTSLAPPATPPEPPMEAPPPAPVSGPNGISIIGRSLGLDRNTDRSFLASLGSGLSSVGKNWNKPGLAALAGSAGDTLTGNVNQQNKTTQQQNQVLNSAINAVQVPDKRALIQAQTQKALADAKASAEGKGAKDSVMNSEQQLYLRAQGATNQNAQLKLLKSQYDNAARLNGVDSPEAQAAKAAHEKAYQQTLEQNLRALGIDPKKAEKIGKLPGSTQDNPIEKGKLKSQADFDALPPGSWFTNPKDGAILQKPLQQAQPTQQAQAPAAAGAPPPAGGQPSAAPPTPPAPPAAAGAPPTPPVPPNAPIKAADDDDDE